MNSAYCWPWVQTIYKQTKYPTETPEQVEGPGAVGFRVL